MAYTSALLTDTSGITTEEWDRLYADSLNSMNSGSTPWEIYTTDMGEGSKKAYMWGAVVHAVNHDNSFCFTTNLDGHMIQLVLGTKKGTEANLYFALYGKNANGSRSWLHDDNWHAHSKEFFAEHNALTLKAESVPGGPMDTYINNTALTNYSGFSATDEPVQEVGPAGSRELRKVRSSLV
jgi:hypothetical protein